MKIKWGLMVTEGRGKLGGHVASKNRSGAYFRTKTSPVNPNTVAQSAVRQELAIVSKAWDSLTEEQRNTWNEAAGTGEWNRNDVFGDSRKPTGKNLFASINLVSRRVTGSALRVVPEKASFASMATEDVILYFLGEGTPSAIELGVQITGDVTSGTIFEVQATPPVSAGRTYFKNDYRFISASNVVSNAGNSLNLGAEWVSKFGEISENQVGKKIAFRYRQVLDGQTTPWQNAVGIIAEPPTP